MLRDNVQTFTVLLSAKAKKDLRKVPHNIAMKLALWIKHIDNEGVIKVRHIKGYHDEPLKGNRKGQRSIRLNKAYRAIYTEYDNGEIELNYIEIDEVNKHDY